MTLEKIDYIKLGAEGIEQGKKLILNALLPAGYGSILQVYQKQFGHLPRPVWTSRAGIVFLKEFLFCEGCTSAVSPEEWLLARKVASAIGDHEAKESEREQLLPALITSFLLFSQIHDRLYTDGPSPMDPFHDLLHRLRDYGFISIFLNEMQWGC